MTDSKWYSIHGETGKYALQSSGATWHLYHRLPDDHKIYTTVGRIASEWSHLEHVLDLVIWELTGGDNARIACITSQLNGTYARAKAIINLLSMFPDSKGAALCRKFAALNGKASDIGERRHRAVHDPWYMESDSGKPAQFKSMPYKDPEFGLRDIDAEEQVKVIEEIRKLTESAATLRSEVQVLLSSFSGKPQKPPPTNLRQTST